MGQMTLINSLATFQQVKSSGLSEWGDALKGYGQQAVGAVTDTVGAVGTVGRALVGDKQDFGSDAYTWASNPTAKGLNPVQQGIGRFAANYGDQYAQGKTEGGEVPAYFKPHAEGFKAKAHADRFNEGTLGNEWYNKRTDYSFSKYLGNTIGPWLANLWRWLSKTFHTRMMTPMSKNTPTPEAANAQS